MKLSADTKMKNKIIAEMPACTMVPDSTNCSLDMDLKMFPKSHAW